MPAVKCACPQCHARLQPPGGLPATVLCPQCGTRFTLTAAGTALLVPQTPRAPAMGILVPAAPKGTTAAPLPPAAAAAPAAPPEPSRGPGLLALLLAGLGLVGALAVAAGVLLLVARLQPRSGPDTPAAAVAAAPAPEAASEPAPAPAPSSAPASPAPRSTTVQARPAPDEPSVEVSLPEKEQERVNKAIDRGVAYVKNRVRHPGEGAAGRLGGQALAGLTLLACGVPAKNPVVRQITTRVRDEAATDTRTYDLALSILFLDRLGERTDRELIRTLAMRLVAGQNAAGGWTYDCPMVADKDRDALIDVLESMPLPGAAAAGDGAVRITRPEAGRVAKSDAAPVRTRPDELSPALKNLPVLRFQPGEKLKAGGGDNSNTQFALMALWVSRKYGAPVDRALAMVEARFRSSQNQDGSWGYHVRTGQYADSMTCAGLLGLAVARGIVRDSAAKGAAQDPDVARALHYLSLHVGPQVQASANRQRGTGSFFGANAHGDLYFLWSVERVAVAYDLRTLEGEDWYGWGAQVLLEHQADDGGWHDVFPGLPDTCFALLFLKRVNVAQDLTATLRSIGSGAGGQRAGGGSGGQEAPRK
jgi:hypothetical protein